jgi:hypothetical protein
MRFAGHDVTRLRILITHVDVPVSFSFSQKQHNMERTGKAYPFKKKSLQMAVYN